MNREQRIQVAIQTRNILVEGLYRAPDGGLVDITQNVRDCVQRTRVIGPGDWESIVQAGAAAADLPTPVQIQVTGETTLEAARRLVEKERCHEVLALNFASARNPGGGFLSGSQAQEESLARSSALYSSLQAGAKYYEENRRGKSLLYTDHAILSPNVPVIRDETGTLLNRPYLVSFLTMPAPNVGAMASGDPEVQRVGEVFRRRVGYIFSLAAVEGYRELILGAWGCGVFGNDPKEVAQIIHERLFGPDGWSLKFRRIIFAVLDRSPTGATLGAFENLFRK
jgi:uncharacterized protein (TIGR02452 family)